MLITSWLWFSGILIQGLLKITTSHTIFKFWLILSLSFKLKLIKEINFGESTLRHYLNDLRKGFIWKVWPELKKSILNFSNLYKAMMLNLMRSKLVWEWTNKIILNFWNVSQECNHTLLLLKPPEELKNNSDLKNSFKWESPNYHHKRLFKWSLNKNLKQTMELLWIWENSKRENYKFLEQVIQVVLWCLRKIFFKESMN